MYSFMYINKIKTKEELEKLQNDLYKDIDLLQMFDNAVAHLDYYKNKSLRKNGVKALNIYFETDNKKIDVNKWKQLNINWVKNKFQTTKETFLQYDFDGDHLSMYIIIIPVDSNGKIGVESYMGDINKMRYLQGSYSEMMKRELGLKRKPIGSIRGSSKTGLYRHTDKLLEKDINIEPAEHESLKDYSLRVNNYIGALRLEYRNKLSEDIEKNVKAKTKKLEKESSVLSNYLDPFIELISKYGNLKTMSQMLKTANVIKYAFRACKESHNDELQQSFNQFLQCGRQYMQEHHIED